ncbi:opine dehydrogenase-like [Magallana gigas]|uniref:Alanopine dehydrogenase 2 n=1 Tax=Magallana gigas TaxID=29159 RepID=B5D5P4_MAGGI|nr:opine dehydrogenase-like [Crassostrea gigas]CAI52505.1 alanopine dehydrogenase 2 [Crassostrea gigas]|eukprot:NP_001295794.1 opine dehydrogenase-like [Crassostrea gigas]
MDGKLVVLTCGGGNGAHCLAGLSAMRPKIESRVLTLYSDEAERWAVELDSGLLITVRNDDGSKSLIKTKPSMVTKDPQKAVPGANYIFFVVPAFAHAQYLEAIAPYIEGNTVIVGLPSHAGFEFECADLLGEKANACTIVAFESLPFVCRLIEFGKNVEILGFKDTLGASTLKGKRCNVTQSVLELPQYIFGDRPKVRRVQNYITTILMAKFIVHPSLMYGKWSQWDGRPLSEKPLFYQGIDKRQAELLSGVSDECVATAKAIEKMVPGLDMSDVIHVFDWYLNYYGEQISDKSNLMTAMRTNKAYDGLDQPMKEIEPGKYVPDFTYRYLSEDVPMGIVPMKGIAELAGVSTPFLDEVITWCQSKLNKEFLVGNKLTGKDLKDTRSPQKYGYNKLEDLFSGNLNSFRY